MAKSFTIRMDASAVGNMFDALEEDIYAATRVAAQAGAQVVYDQVKQNVAAIGKKSGNLAESIYQAFNKSESISAGNRGGRETYKLATYSVSWRTGGPRGLPRAPHGHLIEYGFLQRYESYLNKDGQWKTAVRPEMQGKPKPKRRASLAVKDAYYVLRKIGRIQHTAKPFIRSAVSAFDNAAKAMSDALASELSKSGAVK